jgi:hypothetical protein
MNLHDISSGSPVLAHIGGKGRTRVDRLPAPEALPPPPISAVCETGPKAVFRVGHLIRAGPCRAGDMPRSHTLPFSFHATPTFHCQRLGRMLLDVTPKERKGYSGASTYGVSCILCKSQGLRSVFCPCNTGLAPVGRTSEGYQMSRPEVSMVRPMPQHSQRAIRNDQEDGEIL